jgi:hypothetical protein
MKQWGLLLLALSVAPIAVGQSYAERLRSVYDGLGCDPALPSVFFLQAVSIGYKAVRESELRTTLYGVHLGFGLPRIDIAYTRIKEYDVVHVGIRYSFNGEELMLPLEGKSDPPFMAVPGDGSLYFVRKYAFGEIVEKYVFKDWKFIQIPQPFYFYGKNATPREDIQFYYDEDLTEAVGIIRAGQNMYIIGYKYSEPPASRSQGREPFLILVKSEVGLVGWCRPRSLIESESVTNGFARPRFW